eukprot:TRINITY_DN1222_c2_g1_i1.p1 TRINITY_DN1222_c2_g1~~TRINITY_DN1222_c2_g1_i1.p1  ORF type:complete len:473 (-),score=76.86 TRINITY_DN1222_c2_g1_i1:157-1521(-)
MCCVNLVLLLVCSCCLISAKSSECILGMAFGGCREGIELITNGNFDSPVLSQDWENFGQSINGWSSSSSNGIELWKQGYSGSPSSGVSGQNTGQHLELSGNSPNGYVTASFEGKTCGEQSVDAVLSFDFWLRPGWEVTKFGFVLKKRSQVLLDVDLSNKLSSQKWQEYSSRVTIESGAPYELTFKEDSQSAGGTHIDAVALKAFCKTDDVEQVGSIIGDYDFTNEAKRDNYLNIGLAPSFGKLNKESVKQMDRELKVMIAMVTRDIAKLPSGQRTWSNVVKILNASPVTEIQGSMQTRRDTLKKDGTNFFKFDGSPDSNVVREVKTWFTNLVSDADILDSTRIDINVLARIVAATGVRVDSFESFFFASDSKKQKVLDIGVLRYPDIDHPYFKAYRLQLMAWSKSVRFLFVQDDTNGIDGELKVVKYKPNDEAIKALKDEVLDQAVAEAEELFG